MIAIIGDIHGCYNTLISLYEKLISKYKNIDLYSVGDLIDRGNFSREVFDFIIKYKIKFILGNHEQMFYDSLMKIKSVFSESWKYNGYEDTLNSYEGFEKEKRKHLTMVGTIPLFYNSKDCYISHAGISNRYKDEFINEYSSNLKKFEKVLKRDYDQPYGVLWNREPLANIGKLQVVGHTIMSEITINTISNSIYIDTGAYAGNKLSAVIVENNNILDKIFVYTRKEDIT
ncbi:MAG: serine/threonine protein phosphatase [Ignavibacteriales bacterium]|nr:serine/threonine protein phosphatase [Ignavibacteriales bacterium]